MFHILSAKIVAYGQIARTLLRLTFLTNGFILEVLCGGRF